MMRGKINRGGPLYVGVDIGKDRLDLAAHGFSLDVANDRNGWEKALTATRKLKRQLHFVCEPTGQYGVPFIRFLRAKRKRISAVPPQRAREFAKATGRIAKTDRVDAEMLAELGETLRPEITPKPDPFASQLQAVMRCRFQLLAARRAFERQQDAIEVPALRKLITPVIQLLAEQIKQTEHLSNQALAGCALLQAKHDAFVEVNGVRSLTAKGLLSEMPEIGRLNRKEVAALAGLAPFAKDSGRKKGIRQIRGGRKRARSALYMAAFSAGRTNPVLAPFYKRLRSRGKKHRVALVAVMRKLLIYLNSIAAKVEREFGKPAAVGKKPAIKKGKLLRQKKS